MEIGRQKVTQVFRFLKELHQLRNPVLRDISEQPWRFWFRDLPQHPSIYVGAASPESNKSAKEEQTPGSGKRTTHHSGDDDSRLSSVLIIKRPEITKCPPPPTQIADWLKSGWREVDGIVDALESRNIKTSDGTAEIERFDESSERLRLLPEWKRVRDQWVVNEKPARAALKVFERVYEVWGQLEKESERLELILADGHLKIPEHQVQHPIILQKLTLEFSPKIPEFVFRPTSDPIEFYTALVRQVPGVEGRQVSNILKELDELQCDPLSGEITDGFLRRVAQGLFAPHGKFLENKEPESDDSAPCIWRSPVIFLRRRTLGFSTAVDRILEDLRSTSLITSALLRIVGVETDSLPDESEDRESEPWNAGEDLEILLSKEANEEQLRIAKKLRQNGCVLVQGPPGTGKTHTIANLLGHLLAEGKTVLVTAHTTKALRVLREKVVKTLQPLCISVLDRDAKNQDQLKNSAKEIADRLSRSDSEILFKEAKRLESQRRKIIEETKRLRDQLRQIRLAEIEEIVVGGTGIRPLDAAKMVKSGLGTEDWIPSPLMTGAELPLSPSELGVLYRTNVSLTENDEEELSVELPSLEELVEPHRFASMVEQQSQLLADETGFFDDLWDNTTSFEDADKFEHVWNELQTVIKVIQDDAIWKLEVLRASCEGGHARGTWEDLLSLIDEVAREADLAQRKIMDYGPALPSGGDPETELTLLEEICTYSEGRRSLGFLTKLAKPNWHRLLGECRVSGRPPTEPIHFEALLALARIRKQRVALKDRWQRQVTILSGPSPDDLGAQPERTCQSLGQQIQEYLNWHDKHWLPVLEKLMKLGFRWQTYYEQVPPQLGEHGELQRLRVAVVGSLENIVHRRRDKLYLEAVDRYRSQYTDSLRRYTHSNIVRRMLVAFSEQDVAGYEAAYSRVARLLGQRDDYALRTKLLSKLEPYAQTWAQVIRGRVEPNHSDRLPGDPSTAWLWRQLNDELLRRSKMSIEDVQSKLDDLSAQLRSITADLIDRRTWAFQKKKTDLPQQQALGGYVQTIERIGKGLGKRVPLLLREARNLLAKARMAVPVWIMPLSRVFDSFDPKETKFDVIIIDEASQSDVEALAALYLGRQIIVVGDKEQVTPDAIGQTVSEVSHLIDTLLKEIPNGHLYDGQTSIYDLAETSFGGQVCLREHFRCVPDVIQFSNFLSYDGKIMPLREPASSPVTPAIVAHRVAGGGREDKINKREAEEITSLISACIEQPEYSKNEFGEPTSIGVVSLLGDEQALLIEGMLRRRIPPVEFERRRILCGNAAQFQGDERDIMFLSVVDSSPEDPPLTKRTEGPRSMFKKRYNVAASRARNQEWVVYSLNPDTDLQAGDLRRRLLEHALDPSALRKLIEKGGGHELSHFEREVFERLTHKGYKATPQWQVGAFRIDFVVEGDSVGQRKRLAIECDGEKFHPPEKLQEDMQRQAILERLGWKFYRIRGSSFYRDPDKAMEALFRRFEQLGIAPQLSTLSDHPVQGQNELIQRVLRRAQELRTQWQQEEQGDEIEETVNLDSEKTEINPHLMNRRGR